MKPLYCIVCNRRTPRNFADGSIFNGVYCALCAPKRPGPPPSSGSNAQKPVAKEMLWSLHLSNFEAGLFGDPTDPVAVIRYWRAQESAGYPGAKANVDYFTTVFEKTEAEPPRHRARWQWGRMCGQYGIYCSHCRAGWVRSENVELIAAGHNYCPKCGARMEPFGTSKKLDGFCAGRVVVDESGNFGKED